MFPDQEAALLYLEGRLWPNGARCPVCGLGDRITVRKGGYYRCNRCKEDFTVRTGTIFERSHVPLHKWLYAMYMLVTARKGITSLQLSKEIAITQKSAWFVLQRLREACGNDPTILNGIVEIDEPFAVAATANRHTAIHTRIEAGSTLHTDGPATYGGPGGLFFDHAAINHGAAEYSRDGVADRVLAYRPRPKSVPAKRRARNHKKVRRESTT